MLAWHGGRASRPVSSTPPFAMASTFSTPASTALFRRLTWEGTVPLEIRVDPNQLPANSDRGLECYYVQAPRVSYLPLLVPEIKRFLLDVVFDAAAAKTIKEEEWWFETDDQVLMKWYVCALRRPDGCLYIVSCNLQALVNRAAVRLPHNYDEHEKLKETGRPTVPPAVDIALGCPADR